MNKLKKLRIAILSQDDPFAVPQNIMKLNDLEIVEIISVVTINAKGSLSNKKMMFFKGFGIFQALKMGLVIGWEKLLNKLDQLHRFSLFKKPHSLAAAAHRCGALYKVINNPNNSIYLSYLKDQEIDLIVSFSAPIVFKNKLLNIPQHGCINLHCSLLPQYAGLLPSFWTLFWGEKLIGATVHYIDDKIDNGQILGQVKIPTPNRPSMLRVIKATKDSGGDLVCNVIRELISGTLDPQPNNVNQGSYFSWPSSEQIREFRKRGGRLI